MLSVGREPGKHQQQQQGLRIGCWVQTVDIHSWITFMLTIHMLQYLKHVHVCGPSLWDTPGTSAKRSGQGNWNGKQAGWGRTTCLMLGRHMMRVSCPKLGSRIQVRFSWLHSWFPAPSKYPVHTHFFVMRKTGKYRLGRKKLSQR